MAGFWANVEARVARLLAPGKITEAVWNDLWEEWQDRRRTLRESRDGLLLKIDTHIAPLDQALTIISKVCVLFESMERSEQKALLREMVERVVVDSEGRVLRLELLPPFSYLRWLTQQIRGKRSRSGVKTKTAKFPPLVYVRLNSLLVDLRGRVPYPRHTLDFPVPEPLSSITDHRYPV